MQPVGFSTALTPHRNNHDIREFFDRQYSQKHGEYYASGPPFPLAKTPALASRIHPGWTQIFFNSGGGSNNCIGPYSQTTTLSAAVAACVVPLQLVICTSQEAITQTKELAIPPIAFTTADNAPAILTVSEGSGWYSSAANQFPNGISPTPQFETYTVPSTEYYVNLTLKSAVSPDTFSGSNTQGFNLTPPIASGYKLPTPMNINSCFNPSSGGAIWPSTAVSCNGSDTTGWATYFAGILNTQLVDPTSVAVPYVRQNQHLAAGCFLLPQQTISMPWRRLWKALEPTAR